MDFQELLSQADYNKSEVQYKARVQKYSTELPPPKKVPKSNVQSENIRRFLDKKKAEEDAKIAEARKQRERLLAIRATNSKNNKKAKIMASRTKDNDFSKIRLTEDEIEARNKRERELVRKNLADKVERMKARIEMEEKEKLLPRKRKRKSKNPDSVDVRDHVEAVEFKEPSSIIKDPKSSVSHKDKNHKTKPAAPAMSFSDLLKIAQTKQYEPVQVVAPKKEEVKLMTKKERREHEEELARKKRKQERLLRGETGILPKSESKKDSSEKSENKKPLVIHVGKDVSKSASDASKFKIPKGPANAPSNKNVPVKHKDVPSNVNGKLNGASSNSIGKSEKSPLVNGQKKIRDERETEMRQKMALQKKNGLKTHGDQATSSKPQKIDEAALKAALEKEIREKIEKELEEKIAAKFAQLQSQQAKVSEKKCEPPAQAKKPTETSSSVPKKVMQKPQFSRKDFETFLAMKKQQAMQERERVSKPKLPAKKPFHVNPYLDPPRRLLESRRPPRPPIRRRIESDDDDDDDDDDDMDDFIVDSSQNEENYSEYIKEIFGYDRNKYLDDDEDEIMETSFSEQMKEETRSARLGYLEDLEEERLERLENMRKKKKKMKK